jgi:hypothetical protein
MVIEEIVMCTLRLGLLGGITDLLDDQFHFLFHASTLGTRLSKQESQAPSD